MKLIDFLISESKKGWGWPDSIVKATSTKGGRGVNFYFDYACPPSLSNTLIAPTPFSSSELVSREQYEAELAASNTEWDGEGFPPVGCEFLFGTHQNKAKCIAVGRDVIFASTGNPDEEDGFYEEFVISIHHSEFRPIRSEADKKRDKAIADMVKRIGITPESAATCYEICTHID